LVDLFAELNFDAVTSGADTTAWDPIMIEDEDDKSEDEGVIDSELESGKEAAGVTSGSDPVVEGGSNLVDDGSRNR
jgi:hypothetical protein